MIPSSNSKLAFVLTAMLATAPTLVAAPAQSGQIGSNRALQNSAPPQKVVIPVAPPNPIPINALPFDANAPGYYQVTQDLPGVSGFDGIRVSASPVFIDLNGFSLNGGASGTLTGIQCSSLTGETTVFNGDVFGWGEDGIASTLGCNVVNVNSSFNKKNGMRLGFDSVVQDCKTTGNFEHGIRGSGLTVLSSQSFGNQQNGIECVGFGLTVRDCYVFKNFGVGISGLDSQNPGNPCVIEDCRVTENELGGMQLPSCSQVRGCVVSDHALEGIRVGRSSYVGQCVVTENGSVGIVARGPSIVRGCTVTDNASGIEMQVQGGRIEDCSVSTSMGVGIRVATNTIVANNDVSENQGPGILVTGNANRIEGNHVASNQGGIDVQGTRNLIVRNSLDSNSPQLLIAADNMQGPFLKTKGFIDSTNPWANFDLSFPGTFP